MQNRGAYAKNIQMDIAIIDYGIGNLRSAEKAFQHLGFDAHLTENPAELANAKKIVLPGVGAFGRCMSGLRDGGFIEPLLKEVQKGKPLLGICVGLQMLFERSEESPEEMGLGLLKGSVVKFRGPAFEGANALKIPQIGWNSLTFPPKVHPLFEGTAVGQHVYFVHSYHTEPIDQAQVLAWSEYGQRFCCAAGRENIAGVQFHPEKSQHVGLNILKNFGKQ
jgi:imidazole glycerol-phosphate synthase subunit HisH